MNSNDIKNNVKNGWISNAIGAIIVLAGVASIFYKEANIGATESVTLIVTGIGVIGLGKK